MESLMRNGGASIIELLTNNSQGTELEIGILENAYMHIRTKLNSAIQKSDDFKKGYNFSEFFSREFLANEHL